MKPQKARLIVSISGLFLLLDRVLKWHALHSWTNNNWVNESNSSYPYFGWQPFLNDGIAFSLQIPNQITIILSLVIIFFICHSLYKEFRKTNPNNLLIFSLTFLFSGAFSNFFDRILYKHVIDYFALGTAVINISDIMIVGGLILYLLNFKNKNSEPTD